MWNWLARKEQGGHAAVPGFVDTPANTAFIKPDIGIHRGVSRIEGSTASLFPTSPYPRTLKDIFTMTSAAKASQWGEPGESDTSSDGIPVLGTNFFDDDDDSRSSSDSGEGPYDDAADAPSPRVEKPLYDNYFSGYNRPLIDQLDQSQNKLDAKEDGEEASSNRVIGPSSGILTPLVKVSHEFDEISFQNQNRDLAIGWKLTDFEIGGGGSSCDDLERTQNIAFGRASQAIVDPSDARTMLSQGSHSKPGMNTAIGCCRPKSSPPHSVFYFLALVLPRYRSLLPTFGEPRGDVHPSHGLPEDERGVHGGEYSVRPNMQESMIFLRKLFTHQHQEAGKASFPNFLSPPDNPMRTLLQTIC
jgi:hypothetical protein